MKTWMPIPTSGVRVFGALFVQSCSNLTRVHVCLGCPWALHLRSTISASAVLSKGHEPMVCDDFRSESARENKVFAVGECSVAVLCKGCVPFLYCMADSGPHLRLPDYDEPKYIQKATLVTNTW